MADKEITLESLVGEHVFSGADSGVLASDPENYRYGDANVLRFVLDGVTYTATEDPSDGYRSCLQSLTVGDEDRAVPRVPETHVVARMSVERHDDDVLELIATQNGKTILRVGTENASDYYPGFVGDYMPQDLPCNQEPGVPPGAGLLDWRCRFGWHQWTKWAVLRELTMTYRWAAEPEKEAGTAVVEQHRQCDACGKIQLRTVKA